MFQGAISNAFNYIYNINFIKGITFINLLNIELIIFYNIKIKYVKKINIKGFIKII